MAVHVFVINKILIQTNPTLTALGISAVAANHTTALMLHSAAAFRTPSRVLRVLVHIIA